MQLNTNSGIYMILNTLNGHFYVGSAVNFNRRYKHHLSRLQNSKHYNKYLQRAWNKYGEGAFEFKIITECPRENTISLEQYYLDTLIPEYNICKQANSTLGVKHSPEKLEEIRQKLIGRKCSKEEIEKRRLTVVPLEKRLLIVEMLKEGKGYTEICKKLNTSWIVIKKIKGEFGADSIHDYYKIERDDGLLFLDEAKACRFAGVAKNTINKCIKLNYNCKGHKWFKVHKKVKQ